MFPACGRTGDQISLGANIFCAVGPAGPDVKGGWVGGWLVGMTAMIHGLGSCFLSKILVIIEYY